MTCPRCTIGDLEHDTGKCALCGFIPGGASAVAVDKPLIDEVQETVQRELQGRFQINVLLRHGSRSAVYLADEVESNKLVALKAIPLQRGMNVDLALFEREAAVAASLSHAHIVPVLSYGQTGTLLWYSMEYIKGRSLADLLRDTGPLDLETCQKILEQVASALDYLHRRNVTHGNVKPDNILVDADRWAMVSDACVMNALRSTSESTSARIFTGTPEYMAPEQFRARSVGASADQYSLGIVAYECLSGAVPYIGDSPGEMERMHRTEILEPLNNVVNGLPTHVGQAVQRALGKTPAVRFATVLDFVSMLQSDWAQPAPGTLAPVERPSSTQSRVFVIEKPKRRFRWVIWLAATLFVLVAGGGAFLKFGLASAMGWLPESMRPSGDQSASTSGSSAVDTPMEFFEVPEPAMQDPAPARETAESPTPPPSTQVEQPAPAQSTPTQTPVQTQPRPTQTPVRQAPVAPGLLFVNASPWGQVYIDDELVGNTPLRGMEISPGSHRIRVVRDGFIPFETEIQVAPGQHRRLTNIVLTPRQL